MPTSIRIPPPLPPTRAKLGGYASVRPNRSVYHDALRNDSSQSTAITRRRALKTASATSNFIRVGVAAIQRVRRAVESTA